MRDQAERLRQIAESHRAEPPPLDQEGARQTRVLAVTSGKGGVGKSSLAVNLSYALLALGRQVLLLDADLGLANVDVLLGTMPKLHLGHVVAGKAEILDVIHQGPGGLLLVAGGSGLDGLADLPEGDLQRFIKGLRRLGGLADYLLIDTGAGVGRTVTNFLLAADAVLLVTTPEPTAMTDAYALIKSLLRRNKAADIKLIVNQAQSRAEATEVAERLCTTTLQFLGLSIDWLGSVPVDREVPRSVRNQRPFYLAAPASPASQSLTTMARRLVGDQDPARVGVGLFFDRIARLFSKSHVQEDRRRGAAKDQRQD